jgi:hydrogenase nickel incorporation protein HypA/HybF
MHELSVAQSLLRLTLQHAEAAGGRKVTRLNLVIGQMSSMVDESVQFYWDVVAKGTAAAGARLHFERVPATFRCLHCQANFTLESQTDFVCPQCQSLDVQMTGGDEFRLESIEIE